MLRRPYMFEQAREPAGVRRRRGVARDAMAWRVSGGLVRAMLSEGGVGTAIGPRSAA